MKTAVTALLTLIALFLLVATALPLIREDDWWIRIFDFPRLQIAFVSFITMIALLVLPICPRWLVFILVLSLVVSTGYQLSMIYPYTPLAPKQVLPHKQNRPERMLSIVISNVFMRNRNYAAFLEMVKSRNPDVVLAVETDRAWAEALKPLETTYGYSVKRPQSNTYGMILYSRIKLIDPRIETLVEPRVPSIHTRLALPSHDIVSIHCLHPRPPLPKTETTAKRDVELSIVANTVGIVDLPIIVMGDLNDVAWSRTTKQFQKASGLVDPRRGRGLYNTFDAKNPLLRFPLDHVFHSPDFRLVSFERLPSVGSDHFPIYIKLSYEPVS